MDNDLLKACKAAKKFIDQMRGERVWAIERADVDYAYVLLAYAIRKTEEAGC